MQPINYTENGFGLHEALLAAGLTVVEQNGDWLADDPVAAQAIIDNYDALAVARAEMREKINDLRDTLEVSGFSYLGKRIDSTPRAVERINVATLSAMAAATVGAPFSVDWTCADNSTLALDAAGVIGMVAALAAHGNALHVHARALKDSIMVSDDPASIQIDVGWPA